MFVSSSQRIAAGKRATAAFLAPPILITPVSSLPPCIFIFCIKFTKLSIYNITEKRLILKILDLMFTDMKDS